MTPAISKDLFAFPASYAQERIWFLAQMDPCDPAYQISGSVRFTGVLDVAALQASFDEIVSRHESLRTTFRSVDGALMQVISPEATVRLELKSVADNEILEKAAAIASKPFNLEAGPLLRIALLQSRPDCHLLLLTIHHSIADGWSLMVLIREVMELYGSLVNGAPAKLEKLPIQYADYSYWQRKWLSGGGLEPAIEHWKKKLNDLQATVLPADYIRPAVSKHAGKRLTRQLSQTVSQGLLRICQLEQTTLFMVLLAAFKILLHRHTGMDEIVLGAPVAGRKRVELERLIGCFLNTVVLRTRIRENGSFLDVLKDVREVGLEAYSYEDVPFEKIQGALNLERGSGTVPLFNILFNMLSFPEALEIQFPGVQAELVDVPDNSAKFDLTLYAANQRGAITVSLVYDAELFTQERMHELLAQYELLLEQVSQNPSRNINSISLVTAEAKRVLPDMTAPLDSEWRSGVHDLFVKQVEAAPERIAVSDPHVAWTYRQVDQISNGIANALLSSKLDLRAVVAIYAHRSASLVPSLIGIMKAGLVFVILDPAYPSARLVDYLRLAGAKALLHLSGAGDLPEAIKVFAAEQKCSIVILPESKNWSAGNPLNSYGQEKPSITVMPDDPAYIAFTSGSTGKPKGILGGHKSLSHFAPFLAEKFALTSSDRFSMFSGLAHDPLHRDIFLALMTGGAVFIPDAEGWKEPGQALQWIRQNKISVMNLTPAIGQLIRSGQMENTERLNSLRYIFFVGDALTREDVHAFQKLAPGVACVNLYGATETQQALAHYVIEPQPDFENPATGGQKLVVPVGQGFKDVQLLIFNTLRQLCGIGEIGEIYFRSPHLALGYLDDQELTAERFLANWAISALNHNNKDRDRIYRTGDLGRYLPNGDVEPLGRTDFQVKIRGFRIELEEVEAVLKQHPLVQSAAASVRENESGERYLAAYLVLNEKEPAWERKVSEFLSARVPSYMVPASLVALDQLPLLPNGKINRRSLALMAAPVIELNISQEPQSEDEEILAAIFADALKRKHIGTHENFFAAGGHSLLTVQVLSRVREVFSVELPLRSLFDTATVAGLIRQIREVRRSTSLDIPAIQRGSQQALPLSFAQQRLWFLERLQPGSTAYNMQFGVRIRGPLNKDALQQSLNTIVLRHEVLRTTFQEENGIPTQTIGSPLELPIEAADLQHLSLAEQEQEVRRQREGESKRAFELQTGPLLRVKLLRLGDEEHIVLMTMHHIAGDAWSTGVVIQELSRLYEAFAEGNAPPLPPPPIQYADYATWQREWLQGETLERQLRYWRKQLEGIETVQLPLDHPRPALMSQQAAAITVRLPQELAAQLKDLARSEGVTLFMALLSVWQLLLARYSGQEDITIGTPIAGRTRSELNSLIGFFVNTLVLRTQVKHDSSFKNLLRQVRELCLEAYDHQDVPFEKLVEELQPERDLSRQPFFQIMFGLQTTPQHELKLKGLQLTPLPQEENILAAKFDLTMLLVETDQGIEGRLEYVPDLFEQLTVETLLKRWQMVLEQIAKDTQRPIGTIPLITDAERGQLLSTWQGGKAQEVNEEILTKAVSNHARETAAVALVEDGKELSYSALDGKSNQWAQQLIQYNVSPGTRVIVCLDQLTALLPVALGVLKSGGILVGLDPAEPSCRLQWIAEHCGAALMITTTRMAERFQSYEFKVVIFEEECVEASRQSDGPAGMQLAPESPACVLYQSSSAGHPRGVVLSHKSLCIQEVSGSTEACRIQPSDRVGMAFSFSHDIMPGALFFVLARGACIVGMAAQRPLPPRKLAGVLRDQKVTLFLTSSSLLERMAQEFPAALKGVRQIICEEKPESLFRLRELLKPELLAKIAGSYASFATGGAWLHVAPASTTADGRIRIEHVAAGTGIYLLSRDLEPAPDGVLGEIFIGRPALALEYDNALQESESSFVNDVHGGQAGARLFRTGERAWRRADGTLEFYGRTDRGVKVGGITAYPEEIEAALLLHQDLSTAAVIAQDSADGVMHFTAFVVTTEGQQVVAKETTEFLQRHLVESIVPGNIRQLAEMPQLPKGGIDYSALQKLLEKQSSGASEEYVAPRNEMEEKLAGIWGKLFGLERVGIHDNFFRLGGHSLLATQVVAHISDVLRVEVPLRHVFEAPTVAELARITEQLVVQGTSEHGERIVVVSRDHPLPLSFAQQRLWFLDQLEPGSAAYNLRVAVRLLGDLNREALGWSLQEIVNRHESLRTSFGAHDGSAVQLITNDLKLKIEETDLRGISSAERESELKRLAQAEALTAFDLTRPPLVRVKLLYLQEQESVLLVTMHHIVSDGWSMNVIVKEFVRLYEAYALGQKQSLPPLALQYADYAVWQRQWLTGAVLEKQVGYWRKQLTDIPVMELPTDHPGPAVMSQRGTSLGLSLSEELITALRKLSRNNGVTLFMTLLGSFQLLLSLYSGQSDVAAGSPIAGRTRTDTEGLIGFFINTLVLRARINRHSSFRQLLGHVREVTLQAYEHQDVPFEKLVDELQPDRDLSRQPFFQVMFALQEATQGELQLPGLRISRIESFDETQTSKFDLTMLLEETESNVQGHLEYTPDLFEEATVKAMIGRWKFILESVARNADIPVSQISILADDERQLLKGWSGTERTDSFTSLGVRMQHYAEQYAGFPAVVAAGKKLSWGELATGSNQWAQYLRKRGIEPGMRIGVCMANGLDIAVVSLAVLKCGGVLAGIDANESQARLAGMLSGSAITLVITEMKSAELFSALPVQLALIDDLRAEVAALSKQPVENEISPNSIACILYRSSAAELGAAIMLPHSAFSESKGLPQSEGAELERVGLPIGFSTEMASVEWMRLLASGTCIVDVPSRPVLAPRKMANLIREQQISVLWSSATVVERLAREFRTAFKSVKQIFCCDENSTLNWLKQELDGEIVGRVFNIRGCDETAGRWIVTPLNALTGSTFSGITEEQLMPGTVVHLLDSEFEPTPDHVPGKIFVSGELALGYISNPRLTAELFVPDPYAKVAGARLYCTGEWARRRPGNGLEFCGCRDGRFFVDNMRLEAAELEALLRQHAGVRDAAVVLYRAAGQQNAEIAAAVSSAFGLNLQIDELSEHLQAKLGQAITPKMIVEVETVPRNVEGSIDRKAVQRMLRLREAALAAPEYEAPRNEIEKSLCRIWEEILGIERVGVNHNFFKLGGDSILSIQVIARARQAGIGLMPRQIFEKQTIAELAVVAGKVAVTSAEQGMVTGEAPLTPFQKEFFFWQLARPDYFNQSVLLGLDNAADTNRLEQAVLYLAKHHDALRMKYADTAGGWQQICEADVPNGIYERRDLAALTEDEQQASLERETAQAQASLNLKAGRLLKAIEFNLGAKPGRRLLLVIHHLVVDGVSWRILVDDLERGYKQLQDGNEIDLGLKTTSFKEWGERLKSYAEEDRLKQEFEYWAIQGREKTGRLPLDFSVARSMTASKNLFATQKNVIQQLSEEETRALLQDVPGIYNTQINDVLLTALARVLGQWSVSDAIAIDLEGHGREEIFADVDLSRTVGWCTITYPVVLKARREPTWHPGKTLSKTKEQLRAVPNRGLGYSVLRHLTQDERIREEIEDMPGAEVIFNYLGQVDQVLRNSDLLSPAQENSGVAIAPENRRPYVLDVSGVVIQGRLQMNWSYSDQLHRQETIEKIAVRYMDCVCEIIQHCRSEEAGGFTPSDFPVAEMTQQELAQIASLLGK